MARGRRRPLAARPARWSDWPSAALVAPGAQDLRAIAVQLPLPAVIGGINHQCQTVVRRSAHGTPARLCPRLHHRPSPAPGRRPGTGRLLPGVHRDRQRRPQRPPHPCPGSRPAAPGDTLVVWKLDRLGRSLRHLVDTITGLAERGIGFRSLQEAIDTTTSGGKLVFHVLAAQPEFERDLIRERTAAGLAAARARGRRGGPAPVGGDGRRLAPGRHHSDLVRPDQATSPKAWPAHGASPGSSCSRPLERSSSAWPSAARVVNPSSDRASLANCPTRSLVECSR